MNDAVDTEVSPLRPTPAPKLALAAGLAAFGDWLFYGHEIGISVALFLVGLFGAACLTRPHQNRDRLFSSAGIVVAALLPLIVEVRALSVLCGILGTTLAAAVISGASDRGMATLIATMQRLVLTGPFRLIPDLVRARREANLRQRASRPLGVLAGWVVPVLCGCVFVALFAMANPMVEEWLAIIDPSRQDWHVDGGRTLLWGILLSLAWPFVATRVSNRLPFGAGLLALNVPEIDEDSRFLGTAAIRRSLILFNLLFAVQTLLDVVYLWGGATLPAGMTYAAYAHRGAYPLIATALLAAAFVLTTLRPGGPGERSASIRRLVYLWVGQNVILVISSILRLDLYVATYSLSLMRIAAFIWMLLVGAGLILIIVRIALRRSNLWLVRANLLTVAVTLYACSFMDFSAIAANYNLSSRRETLVSALAPDLGYVRQLGPHAIPALDRYIARHGVSASSDLVRWRNWAASDLLRRLDDWRAWSLRDWRLKRYLVRQADDKGKAMASGQGL
ncbi:DUF4153 domain-containing protein [Microvirga puerhi]|uniref:DUF4173 domain-containing protein n=1 Tax=Microvirga puerhi TaxID=2876078 RepID=A0ABS7VWC4_9HYPH|nr:DUF4173 domain-containing protein [Microvirga puerhi]MBZ6079163.1 DUF4173 domain-containing protein [Microvirga puerhi]